MMHDAVDDRGGHVPVIEHFFPHRPNSSFVTNTTPQRQVAALGKRIPPRVARTHRSDSSHSLALHMLGHDQRRLPSPFAGKGEGSRVHRAWPPSSEQCPVRGLYGYASGLSFELTDTRAGIVIPLLPRSICGYWHSGIYQEPHGTGASSPADAVSGRHPCPI